MFPSILTGSRATVRILFASHLLDYDERVPIEGNCMILVTGAAGFIGSVIVHELNVRGEEDLLLCDHFENGDKWKNLRGLKFDSFVTVENLFSHPIWKKPGGLKAIYHMVRAQTQLRQTWIFFIRTTLITRTDFSHLLLLRIFRLFTLPVPRLTEQGSRDIRMTTRESRNSLHSTNMVTQNSFPMSGS